MKMVKLKDEYGATVYIRPENVFSVIHRRSDCCNVHAVDGTFHPIQGSVDEIAALIDGVKADSPVTEVDKPRPPARHPDDVAKIAELEAEVKAWKDATHVPGFGDSWPAENPATLRSRLRKNRDNHFYESIKAKNAQEEVAKLEAEVKRLKEAGMPVLHPDRAMMTAKEIAQGHYNRVMTPKDRHWDLVFTAIDCAYEATGRSLEGIRPYPFDHDKL